MSTYSVLIYSKDSPICRKLFSYMNLDHMKNFHIVNADYPETRKRIINSGIKEVPCFIICFQDDYTVERYEGLLALKWFLRVYLPQYRKALIKQQDRIITKEIIMRKEEQKLEEDEEDDKSSLLMYPPETQNVQENFNGSNRLSTNQLNFNKGEGHDDMVSSSVHDTDFTSMNSEIKTPKKIDINQVKSQAMNDRPDLNEIGKIKPPPKIITDEIPPSNLNTDDIVMLSEIEVPKTKKTKTKTKLKS